MTSTEATASETNPRLDSSEALELVQQGGVIATPSAALRRRLVRGCTYSPGC